MPVRFSIRVITLMCVVLLGSMGGVAAQQAVLVGNTEVTWSSDWEHDPASSMPEQVTLIQVDATTGALMLASYGEFADGTVSDPQEALDAFTVSFFEGAGAEATSNVGSGELDDGGVWELHTFDLQGLSLTLLITVEIGMTGDYVVTTLTANSETFDDSLTTAQSGIMLDGELTFFEGVEDQMRGADGGSASRADQLQLPSAGALQIVSVTTEDAGIGDGSMYVYVEVANGSSELYPYVGLEGTCQDSEGGVLGTGWGDTVDVAPGETIVIVMVFQQVPGCTDVDVRFDALTGMT